MTSGLALLVIGFALLGSVVHGFPGYMLAFGGLAALGFVMAGFLPMQSLVSAWFARNRGTATSVMLSGMGLGGLVWAITVSRLLQAHHSWRAIVFLFAVVTLQPFAIYSGGAVSVPILVALLVCLIPTTIGGLLSAIGIAGMDRMIQHNVIAMSGRAVEAAGDVNTLLLDKTGTITLGNRQAVEFVPAPGVTREHLADRAQLASLPDETPEGRSIVVLAKEKYGAAIDKTVFPGFQGGPLVHIIAAKAVCFKEAMAPEFITYQKQVVANAKTLAESLAAEGYRIVSGGTDTHLLLVDVFAKGIRGKEAESGSGPNVALVHADPAKVRSAALARTEILPAISEVDLSSERLPDAAVVADLEAGMLLSIHQDLEI